MVMSFARPANFDVTTCGLADGSVVMRVTGEVDCCASIRLRTDLLAACHVAHAGSLRLDLGGVTFIDCAGLGALCDGATAAQVRGVPLHLESVSPSVAQIIELAGPVPELLMPDATWTSRRSA